MDSSKNQDLYDIVQRYAEVARKVNRREMKRFIEYIEERWAPDPNDIWPEDGYTDAGAFAQCVWDEAFRVLLHVPLESFADWAHSPLTNPQPGDEITKMRLAAPLKIPADFATLMSFTDGMGGVGVPPETDGLMLVYPLELQRAEPQIPLRAKISMSFECGLPIAAWKIGGSMQHRSIYYALFQDRVEDDGAVVASWKVFDYSGVDSNAPYDCLADFIANETKFVESNTGGAQSEWVLCYDRYPTS